MPDLYFIKQTFICPRMTANKQKMFFIALYISLFYGQIFLCGLSSNVNLIDLFGIFIFSGSENSRAEFSRASE